MKMGRRYRNTYSRVKETITYHVYEDGVKVGEYVGDKPGAVAHFDRLQGISNEIRKTRVQTPIDKSE
jgi:hypothetical protein